MHSLFRDTLYTWTTPGQIDSLRKNKILFTKSRSDKKALSLYDRNLHDAVVKDDYPAKLLSDAAFSKKRFAWTEAWPTVMGWEKEKYGHQLLQIVLNDSAIFAHFVVTREKRSSYHQLEFFNWAGESLTSEYVFYHQHRIAAVLHTNTDKIKKREYRTINKGTLYKIRKYNYHYPVFSEFVIINEKMVADWNYGTDNIKNKIKEEITFLDLLVDPEKNSGLSGERLEHWQLESKFRSRLCFDNAYYELKPENINAIIKELQTALNEQSEPFSK